MKTIDTFEMLQCPSCKKNYQDFIKLGKVEDPEILQLLKDYSVFMELRRLKEKTIITTPTVQPGQTSPYTIRTQPYRSPWTQDGLFDPNRLTVTC